MEHDEYLNSYEGRKAVRAAELLELKRQAQAAEDWLPSREGNSDPRVHSTDPHRGSAPSSSRDLARRGSSSAARPGPAGLFGGDEERDADDSILYDQSFRDPEQHSSALLYLKKGSLHIMPRSFCNESNAHQDSKD